MNIFLALSLRFFGVFLSFLLNVYLSRVLDKDDLGQYFLLLQILLVLSVFLRRGTDTALLKFAQKMNRDDLYSFVRQYCKSTIGPLCLLSLLCLLLSYLFLSYRVFTALSFILLSLIPFALFNLAAEYIKGLNHQISSTLIQTCLLPVFLFFTYYFIKPSVYFSFVIAVLLTMGFALYQVKKINFKLVSNEKKSTFSLPEFWVDSNVFMVVGVLNIVMNSMDLIMLGVFKSSEQVAEYAIANKFVALSSVLLIGVNGLLGPRFSAFWQLKKHQEIYTLFVRVTCLMSLFALFLLLFFIFYGELLLTTIYGDIYANSAPLLMILAIGQCIVLSTGPVAYLLMMTDSKAIHQKSLVLAVGVNLLLNLMLIPKFGAMGAAVATAIGLMVKNMYSFHYLIFKTDFRKMKYGK